MDVFELAKQYYPRLWDRARIQALADAGKLTEEQIGRASCRERV